MAVPGGPIFGHFRDLDQSRQDRPFDHFAWSKSRDIKCIFIPREVAAGKRTLTELIKQHCEVDNILGSHIGFLVMFPDQIIGKPKKGKTDNPETAFASMSLAEILEDYAVKPELMAEHHASAINVFCEAFGIAHDHLPAMVILLNVFPEEPIVLRLNEASSLEDILGWLRKLRSAVDKMTARTSANEKELLDQGKHQLQQIKGKIDRSRKELREALNMLASQLKLPEEALQLLVPLVSRTSGISEAFATSLAEIKTRYAIQPTSKASQRKVSTVTQHAKQLENDCKLTKKLDVRSLHDVIELSHKHAKQFVEDIKTITESSRQKSHLMTLARKGLAHKNDVPRVLKYGAGLVSAVEHLLKVLGL